MKLLHPVFLVAHLFAKMMFSEPVSWTSLPKMIDLSPVSLVA